MSETPTERFRREFEDQTDRYLDTLMECTARLSPALECYGQDADPFWDELEAVHRLESDCDDLLQDLRLSVAESMQPNFTGVFFQPGPVLELFARLDAVPNAVEQFLTELAAMTPSLSVTALSDFVRMADIVTDAMATLVSVTADLCDVLCGTDAGTDDIHRRVESVIAAESRCDTVRDKLLSDAFAETDTAAALVVRALALTLDRAMDAVEDAAEQLVYVDSVTVRSAASPEPR
ncbi:hypothetical protein [Halorientalis litorea]|jgi:uncharacterized protein Yka (UPF0111/DUF47 family)|uniref:hypothetical protein n=1 Tax=Halorientalis litorea TaxID=2931977 RepID=UPI001FF3F942|nr:hypothetical protein [Halorientalis litorea]